MGGYREHTQVLSKMNQKNHNTIKYDEIIEYMDYRYLGPIQAPRRSEEFSIYNARSNNVIKLAVHLNNQHKIIFDEN